MKLELGCGPYVQRGYVGADRVRLPGVEYVFDLEKDVPWPIPSDSCEVVRAFNILEHLHEVVPAMEQIHRILKPGGIAWIQVPDYRWEGAYWDPTHHSFFTPHTMTYFEPGNPHAYYTRATFRIQSMKVIKHGPFASYIEKHGSGRLLGSINQVFSRSPQCIEWKLEAVKP